MRQDGERDRCRRRTGDSIRGYRAHQKAIIAACEVGVVDGALRSWRTPIRIDAVQFVLVAQHLASRKAQPHEINLQLILTRGEVSQGNFILTDRRNMLGRAEYG